MNGAVGPSIAATRRVLFSANSSCWAGWSCIVVFGLVAETLGACCDSVRCRSVWWLQGRSRSTHSRDKEKHSCSLY